MRPYLFVSMSVDQLIAGEEMTRIGAAGSRFSSEQRVVERMSAMPRVWLDAQKVHQVVRFRQMDKILRLGSMSSIH